MSIAPAPGCETACPPAPPGAARPLPAGLTAQISDIDAGLFVVRAIVPGERRVWAPAEYPYLRTSRGLAPGQAGHVVVTRYASGWKITISAVAVPYQRTGIGRALYQAASRQACRRGSVLLSDSVRTGPAECLWRGFVRDGVARCAPVPLDPDLFDPKDCAEAQSDAARPVYGRNACDHYVMSCPTPVGRRSDDASISPWWLLGGAAALGAVVYAVVRSQRKNRRSR